mgnify:CR=1 FL=1
MNINEQTRFNQDVSAVADIDRENVVADDDFEKNGEESDDNGNQDVEGL